MGNPGTPVRAVLIGLQPILSESTPEHFKPFIKLFEKIPQQMADEGIQYEFIAVEPKEGLADVGPKLEAARPDVVVIGNGIRSNVELTSFLEQIIDNVRTHAPQAKLAFNTRPDTSVDAVKRWWPTSVAK